MVKTQKKTLWRLSVFLVVLISSCSLNQNDQQNNKNSGAASSGSQKEEMVWTRDLSGKPPQTYAEFKKAEKIDGAQLLPRTIRAGIVNRSGSGKNMLVVVNALLYPQVADSITGYCNDLIAEGYNAIVLTVNNNGSPEDLKALLQQYYSQSAIEGALLIGNLPVAWMELIHPTEGLQQFPCDYFLMDLDGIWQDLDGNGVYDVHGGNYQADIWVSRIVANLTANGYANSEALLVNNYFNKAHMYRLGTMRLKNKSFTLVEKDWASKVAEGYGALGSCYPDNTVYENLEGVSPQEYLGYIAESSGNQFESELIFVHSDWDEHSFTKGTFLSSDIEPAHCQVNFYNLFACGAGQFTEKDCIAVWYAMQTRYGLNVVASTKSGSMQDFNSYYQPLRLGNTFGQSFLSWYRNADTLAPERQLWIYGMVMFGDPTLKISRFMNNPSLPLPCPLYVANQLPGPITFSWNPVPGATGYTIHIIKTGGSSPSTPINVTGPNLNTSLDSVGEYCWTVQAQGIGNSPAVFGNYFRIISAPVITMQAYIFTSGDITLQWDPVIGASSYTVMIQHASYPTFYSNIPANYYTVNTAGFGYGNLNWNVKAAYNLDNFSPATQSKPLVVLPDLPSAYYPFEGDAADYSINGRNGSVYNTTAGTDRFGANSALVFNGTSAYVNLPGSSMANSPEVTMAVWFKKDPNGSAGTLISEGDPNPHDMVPRSFVLTAHCFSTYIGGQPSLEVITPGLTSKNTNNFGFDINQWNFFVFTFNRSTGVMDVYRNGSFAASVNNCDFSHLGYYDIKVGSEINQGGNGRFFTGSIDDVMLYSRELTAAEIQGLYNFRKTL